MYKCSNCGEVKDASGFTQRNESTSKTKLTSHCKVCKYKQGLEYGRSERGVLANAYSTQRASSRKRKQSLPQYTLEELINWVNELSDDLFNRIYTNWVKSGYSKSLVPSIDRLNPDLPYTFDNIQLVTFRENEINNYIYTKFVKSYKVPSSGYRGVTWDKGRNKWRSQISIDSKKVNLGTFEDIGDAVNARYIAESNERKRYEDLLKSLKSEYNVP